MSRPFRHWCHDYNRDPESFDSRWSYMDELNRRTSAITPDALRAVDGEDPGVQQARAAMESLAATVQEECGHCSNRAEIETLWIHCSRHWFEPIQRVQRGLSEAGLRPRFNEQASSPEACALVRPLECAAAQYFELRNTVVHGDNPSPTVKTPCGR